jgi:NADPH-dependent FMN reductase
MKTAGHEAACLERIVDAILNVLAVSSSAVTYWRIDHLQKPARADRPRRCLVISSLEYAHGVPGTLKNALDWLVSGVEIYGKPVALLNPSPRSLFAHPQLAETLRTMGALIVDGASVSLPISGRRLDASGIAADPPLVHHLRDVLQAIVAHRQASR